MDSLVADPILVLDDDSIVLNAVRETLSLEGYAVVATRDPAEAMEYLQRQTFSIVMSDQRMADTTGIDFLAHAKTIRPEGRRILLTGVLSVRLLTEAINRAEIFRFLSKPWTRVELLKVVEEGMEIYRRFRVREDLYRDVLRLNESLAEENRRLLSELKRGTEAHG
jgi:response regulator RpfG family c-di-GMP phosphodiesterase